MQIHLKRLLIRVVRKCANLSGFRREQPGFPANRFSDFVCDRTAAHEYRLSICVEKA